MWYLVGKNNGKVIYLLSNKKLKIGRHLENNANDVDIAIDADQTISRLHAELFMKNDQQECTNLESRANIILTDNSKFGTFVNNVKVDGFKTVKQNDMIRFGLNNSVYELRYEPLIVTTSTLSNQNKQLVKQFVCKLGGHMVNDWHNDCSLLVMDSIKITVKVIDALICQKRIVKTDYLNDLVKCVETRKELPNPENYLPPVVEKCLLTKRVNFEPSSKRKILFQNKKFIFFNPSQLEKMQNIIELASGECELFNKNAHLNLESLRKNGNMFIFVLNCDSKLKEAKENQKKLEAIFENLNLKLIDESEIGLAILFIDLNDYCNPLLSPAKKSETKQSCPIIAPQTLTDTYFRENFLAKNNNFDTQQQESMAVDDIPETPTDSLMLQLENKIDDIYVVNDTPEKIPKNPVKHQSPIRIKQKLDNLTHSDVTNSKMAKIDHQSTKTHNVDDDDDDFEMLKDDFDFNSGTLIKPNQVEKKSDAPKSSKADCEPKVEVKLETVILPVEIQTNSSNQKSKQALTLTSQKTSFKREKLNTPSGSSTSSSLVYSKNKPPPGSIHSSKQEDQDAYSSVKSKIVFDSLVVVRKTTQQSGSSSKSGQNGRRNFKKFRKIPKALKKNNSNELTAQEAEYSKFKACKKENFDLDSQFEMFMSSMR